MDFLFQDIKVQKFGMLFHFRKVKNTRLVACFFMLFSSLATSRSQYPNTEIHLVFLKSSPPAAFTWIYEYQS